MLAGLRIPAGEGSALRSAKSEQRQLGGSITTATAALALGGIPLRQAFIRLALHHSKASEARQRHM
jgi:hypothetical protein